MGYFFRIDNIGHLSQDIEIKTHNREKGSYFKEKSFKSKHLSDPEKR